METYNEIYSEKLANEKEQALKKYSERAKKNIDLAETYKSNINETVDESTEVSVNRLNEQLESIPAYYQSAYDSNAVQQAINERQIEERMANLGLANSGLNSAQQQAIKQQKTNYDLDISLQKNAMINSIKSQIADIKSSGELTKKQNEIEIKNSLKQQNQSIYNSYIDYAEEYAKSYADSYSNSLNSQNYQAIENYDNGTLDTSKVKVLQEYFKTEVDGKWGEKSVKATGGLTADEAWTKYLADGNKYWSDEYLASKAADYFEENPDITLDSRTLDMWLNDNEIRGKYSQKFKAFLQKIGAKTSNRS